MTRLLTINLTISQTKLVALAPPPQLVFTMVIWLWGVAVTKARAREAASSWQIHQVHRHTCIHPWWIGECSVDVDEWFDFNHKNLHLNCYQNSLNYILKIIAKTEYDCQRTFQVSIDKVINNSISITWFNPNHLNSSKRVVCICQVCLDV